MYGPAIPSRYCGSTWRRRRRSEWPLSATRPSHSSAPDTAPRMGQNRSHHEKEAPMPVDLAPELLEILACPNCHGALAVDDEREELVCVAAECGLAYPVRQQIPVLLIDEARRPDSRAGRPGTAPGR